MPIRVCAVGQKAPCTRLLEGVTSIGAGDRHSIAVSRPSADLATSIAASPEPVVNGGTLTYTVVPGPQPGPTAAENVVLTDHFISATPSTGGICDKPPAGSTDTVTCSFGTLSRGGDLTLTIQAKALLTYLPQITNAAEVTSGTPTRGRATTPSPSTPG